MEKIEIRNVRKDEDGMVRTLASACGGTLDVHTPYTYWVLTHYFTEYCFVAKESGKGAVGFLTAVVNDKKALIWQAGVLPAYAGRRIGQALLDHLIQRLRECGVSCAETTIAGSNAASRALLLHYCERNGIPVEACGPAGPQSDAHDGEILYRLALADGSTQEGVGQKDAEQRP